MTVTSTPATTPGRFQWYYDVVQQMYWMHDAKLNRIVSTIRQEDYLRMKHEDEHVIMEVSLKQASYKQMMPELLPEDELDA